MKFFHRFILPQRWRSRIFDQNISKFFFEKVHSLYKKCMRGLFLIVREYILRQNIMNMLHLIRHWENVESMSLYWWSRYRYQRFNLHFISDINKNRYIVFCKISTLPTLHYEGKVQHQEIIQPSKHQTNGRNSNCVYGKWNGK